MLVVLPTIFSQPIDTERWGWQEHTTQIVPLRSSQDCFVKLDCARFFTHLARSFQIFVSTVVGLIREKNVYRSSEKVHHFYIPPKIAYASHFRSFCPSYR